MHDDRLGRPDPSLDLRDRARRRGPNNSWSTVATSFPSVGQVLVHVLHKEETVKKIKIRVESTVGVGVCMTARWVCQETRNFVRSHLGEELLQQLLVLLRLLQLLR